MSVMEEMDTSLNSFIHELNNFEKDEAEFNKHCSKVLEEVKSHQKSFLQLVEDLHDLLVNTSPSKREQGILVLTNVLEQLPVDFFNGEQLTFIATFYSGKLKDHHQVVPATLRGIVAITKFDNFPDGAATQILTSIFHNIACQQQQQIDRHNIYRIFQQLFEIKQTELCSMGLDYIFGTISAIDSERDPRNLLFIFNWMPKFLKGVTLGHLTEEMFEVLACYFPVDFRAPPQDPNSITRESLADALCLCLCAISDFAEHCIPLALEKLSSSLQMAKIDSLKLLKEGCKTFEESVYMQHAPDIWSQIQRETFNALDLDFEIINLQTLSTVIKKLSAGEQKCSFEILKDISYTVKGNLLPDSKLFTKSLKLLLCVTSASEPSSIFMVKEIVPVITNTYNITTSVEHKIKLINSLTDFIKAYAVQNKSFNIEEIDELKCIPVLCLKASVDPDDKLRAAGFGSLKKISKFLSPTFRNLVGETLSTFLMKNQSTEARTSILNCFREFAMCYEKETSSLIDTIETNDTVANNLFLNAICYIADLSFFTELVISKLLLSNNFDSLENGKVVVTNLQLLLEKHENNENILRCLVDKAAIFQIAEFSIKFVLNKSDQELLTSISFIIKVIIGSQISDTQDLLIENFFKYIDFSKEKDKSLYVFLLDGVLSRANQIISTSKCYALQVLIEITLNPINNFVGDVTVQLLGNLINKCLDDEILVPYLGNIKTKCLQCLRFNIQTVPLLAWTTKALFMKNHKDSMMWCDMLIELLDEYEEMAKAFRIIMNDNYGSIDSKSSCIKSVLYKQKFFTVTTNKLSAKYDESKSSYLVAIGYLLEFAPQQAIILQFKKILKLLILCLELCKEPEVLGILLQIIEVFIINKESVVEDHLEEFLTRILALASFESSMKIRILALKCLKRFSESYPIYKLLPVQKEVLRTLGKCVDDKKRLVRKEAAEARSLWFLLDAPM